MAKAIEQRLSVLERQQAEKRLYQGIRCFQQNDDNAAIFFELPGPFFAGERSYTSAEISALSEQGWTCIIGLYGSERAARAALA